MAAGRYMAAWQFEEHVAAVALRTVPYCTS